MSLSKPRRRAEVAHVLEEDGSIALFDRAGARLLVLDPIGAGVWCLADGTRSRIEIVNEIRGVFDVPVERVSADVDSFLAEMSRSGMLVSDDDGAG